MQMKKEYRFSAYFVVIGIFFLSGVIFGFTGQTFGTLLSSMSFCGVGTVMLYGSYKWGKKYKRSF
jgi:hypothetical protein